MKAHSFLCIYLIWCLAFILFTHCEPPEVELFVQNSEVLESDPIVIPTIPESRLFVSPSLAVVELNDTELNYYLNESASLFNVTSNSSIGHYIFVKFYAPWCKFSQQFSPEFKKLSLLFPNITMASVDTYKYTSINSRWGIYSFPTLLLFKNGEFIAKFFNTTRSMSTLSDFLNIHTDMIPDPVSDIPPELDQDDTPLYEAPPMFSASWFSQVNYVLLTGAYIVIRILYKIVSRLEVFHLKRD